MKSKFLALGSLLFLTVLTGCGVSLDGSPENQRRTIQAMEADTLNKVSMKYPGARRVINRAVGYAVFDSSGGKFMFGGMDHGNGVAVDNRTKKRTYMKMFELQPGLGFGFENFRLVYVFTNREVFDDFVTSGWEFGARAAAAARDESKKEGGSAENGVQVRDGMTMYQLSIEGIIVGVSLTGAKFWLNDELNQPAQTVKKH